MSDIELAPDPHLLESMRAVGYSFETSVADIIDNSIAANASCIHLLASPDGPFRFAVLDDGAGMSRNGAIEAMTLAARSPSEERSQSDLGRFGLGLKTASLAQCRRLSVVTKRDGVTSAFRWDLDHVLGSKRWLLQELDADMCSNLFGWDLLDTLEHGTLVCWDELDLLVLAEGQLQSDFDSAVRRVQAHCELVFHRFISGSDMPRVEITVNGNHLTALDPFLRTNRATRRQSQAVSVAGVKLDVTSYTMPFASKLSPTDRARALAPGAFRDSQGFYIYRGGRLVIWGTWFRLNPKTELGKLARVQVDVPTSLDHLWALDIKKSAATPPRELRDKLRTLANEFIRPSRSTNLFRGLRPKSQDSLVRAWQIVEGREQFYYEINRDHPVVSQFESDLTPDQLERLADLFGIIERTLPLLDAHNRLSQDANFGTDHGGLDVLVEEALRLRPIFAESHPADDEFVSMVLGIDPYGSADGFEVALRKAMK
ncbi:ATPase [Flexivirga endophytica]|uniref:ATPase n=1 Tax=Flexivirga endophytica TaxID=1849103 RepID=A0A916WNB3_9MICO|nr:ATP-binding protein [Flexivirga endophytica]GGB18825.1 ATPase [Flexivirga endophytica]GHB36836.1 ATPase [Flexivirga endophytica]